jgi:hypothetical protein
MNQPSHKLDMETILTGYECSCAVLTVVSFWIPNNIKRFEWIGMSSNLKANTFGQTSHLNGLGSECEAIWESKAFLPLQT